ncbi:DUF1559 domain-containing protein [Cerasicoccus maritimus]|uniref:DUF1559 family PulG-like putative transporter n=1 Tax=Cerasicoccus maritimus TaxID=490089 RepID=UPI00285281FD|nr:DUF1559 domain-containing protein [Cerasicoccus maritimus]
MKTPLNSRLNKSRKALHGFTLIELLAVITIVAILGAILMTVVTRVRQYAHTAQCTSNMRQLGLATMSYVQGNGGAYPLSNDEASWDARLIPFLDHQGKETPAACLKCPADPRDLKLGENSFARSYAASAPHRDGANGELDGRGMIRNDFSRRLNELSNPTNTVLFTEWFTTKSGETILGQQQFKPSYAWITGWYGGVDAQNWPRFENGDAYHGQVMNFCFADGHVESLEPWEVNGTPNRWRAVSVD